MFDRDRSHTGKRSRQLNAPGIVFFLVVSILLHAVLFLIRFDLGGAGGDPLMPVQLLDDASLAVATDEKRPEPPPPPVVTPEPEKVEIPSGQIVDIARPENEKRPQETRFLARYDSTVPREKRSAFDKDIPIRGRELQRMALPPTAKLTPQSDELVTPGDAPERREKKEELIRKGDIAGFDGTQGELAKGAEKETPGRIDGDAPVDRKGQEATELSVPLRYLPYFLGDQTMLISPSNDYLKDIPEEDETALNARRFLYADYYNRIKKAVSYYWTPGKVLMVHDPGGNIFGAQDRYTKIEAVLDERGRIVSIQVTRPSGADVLDREAVDAFKAAAPFPNPPAPLLRNGRLAIQFGFYVSIDR